MATYLGSLVQLCCAEGGTLQTNTAGTCGECSQWMDHTGFATAQGGLYIPGPHCSCPGSSARALFHVDPVFRALPSSKPLRFSGALQGHRPRWAVHFVLFPGASSSGDWVLGECTVLVGLCVLLPQPPVFPGAPREHSSWCALCLLWGADLRL